MALNGARGGLVAGILFVLPGIVALLGLSAVYVVAGDSTVVAALFAGLAPAVLAIVAQAVVRVSGRALGHPALLALATGAFPALAVLAVPSPAAVAAAAVIRMGSGPLSAAHDATCSGRGASGPAPLIPDHALHQERPTRTRTLKVVAVGLLS